MAIAITHLYLHQSTEKSTPNLNSIKFILERKNPPTYTICSSPSSTTHSDSS